VTVGPADPAADVVVVPPAEVGAWTVRTDARVVPAALRGEDPTAQWPRILTVYRDRLAGWGPEVRAVPLAGDGYVLAYRADRFAEAAHQQAFRAKFGRPLAAPATWEDVADVAEYFAAATGKPSLSPVPADPAGLLREFHFVAACYDRPALTESALTRGGVEGRFDAVAGARALSFHHDIGTGKPRLTAPGFEATADWLGRVGKFRMPAGSAADPAAALDTGTAVVALLTLAELGRLPKDGDTLSDRFGLGPPPGTRGWFDPENRAERPPPDRVKGVNYVPYYGSGGWVGIVREGSAAPDAAFNLLAELAGPDRSADRLADPKLGFGPFRTEHLEAQRGGVWQRYGLDPDRLKRLAEALRQYTAQTLANPAFAPRGPDQGELLAALEKEVRRAAAGQAGGADAMAAAQAAWEKLDARHPPGTTAGWRRKSAGLE
jgi:ABC-type glycerol-3-phosphate transport system substrate-binding protein